MTWNKPEMDCQDAWISFIILMIKILTVIFEEDTSGKEVRCKDAEQGQDNKKDSLRDIFSFPLPWTTIPSSRLIHFLALIPFFFTKLTTLHSPDSFHLG